MAPRSHFQFLDLLPAVFRQQDERAGRNFLRDFLRAFESTFAGIQEQLDTIPYLFAVFPSPALATAAVSGAKELQLDSATGLCPGDVLRVGDADSTPVEFVHVQFAEASDLAEEFAPTKLRLVRELRFNHEIGTPLRVVQQQGGATTLSRKVQPANDGEQVVAISTAGIPTPRRADVLMISDGEHTEYVEVTGEDAKGGSLTVSPRLKHSYEAGCVVALMNVAPTMTPSQEFTGATRTGADLVLQFPAQANEAVLRLDTITGLSRDDVLRIDDGEKEEILRVQAILGFAPDVANRIPNAVSISPALRFSHDVGVGVHAMAEAGKSRLGESFQPSPDVPNVLAVEKRDQLAARVGDLLQIGDGGAEEYARVVEISASGVSVLPPLESPHEKHQPIVRLLPVGGGMAYLRWLASWIGLHLREDRGERWNRELLRLAARILPWRGTRVGIEAMLNAYLRGEAKATVIDPANSDDVVNEDELTPHGFDVELALDANTDATDLSRERMEQIAREVLDREKPAHTFYVVRTRTS